MQSPLALPDLLVHLMDWTLESVWENVRTGRNHSLETVELNWIDYCQCSANPLTYYFLCAKDCCVEILDREANAFPPLSPGEKQACCIELLRALDQVAEREIKTFCAVCQRSSRGQNGVTADQAAPSEVKRQVLAAAPKTGSRH